MGDLRARILAADDLGREEVEVPEWAETIEVRGMTAGEVEKFGMSYSQNGAGSVMAQLVAKCSLDSDGTRLFPDPADVQALEDKNPVAVKRLFEAILRVSGMEDDHEGN